MRMGELSYWVECYFWLEKCGRRWLMVASVSHNLCEILKVSKELGFKSGVHIGQISRINGHGDKYKSRGELAKLEKWSQYSEKMYLHSVGMEDPAEIVCFEY